MQAKKQPRSLAQLTELLATFTSINVEEIQPDSDLEEGLGINLLEDFPRLAAQINHEFEIKLVLDEVLDELDEAGPTVEELAKLIDLEIELG